MQALEFIAVRDAAQLANVAQLAREIWPEHYLSIIGQAQVDYMLARFQSEAAIAAQLKEGYEYFLIRKQGEYVGYASVREEPAAQKMFVSKLYLLHTVRGQGVGWAAMQFLAQRAEQHGLRTLWLTVNKFNPALQAYLRMGFVKVAAVVTDIGDGYVMDDFQLEWTPASIIKN